MKTSKKLTMTAVAALTAGLMLGGCGDNFNPNQVAGVSLPTGGKLVMGPISGATVCADLNANLNCDAGEAFDITDANGDFSFERPDGDYKLLSVGGIDTLTGGAAPKLEAPKDAANVTPATDLVAKSANPEATKALLNSLGGSYDADISAAAGVSANLMKVVKAVETARFAFEDVLGVTDEASINTLVASIAAQLVSSTETDVDTLLSSAISAAAVATVDVLVADPANNISFSGSTSVVGDLISQAVAQTTAAINSATAADGTVVEDSTLQTSIETAVDTVDTTAVTSTLNNVQMMLVDGSLQGLNAQGVAVSQTNAAGDIVVPSSVAQLTATVAASNDFATAKSYTASVVLTIDDVNSTRLVRFTVANVQVDVQPGANASVNLTSDSNSTLSTFGQTATGTTILTNAVNGPFESVQFASNTVTFDIAALQQLLSDQVSAQFGDISLPGTYNVAITVSGAPVSGVVETVVIQ